MMALDDYLDKIPSQNRDKPNFIAMLTALVNPFISITNKLLNAQALYNIDTAAGEQLDRIGEWVGISRRVYIPTYGDTLLDDEYYRVILFAKIVRNSWDGTIPEAYRIFDAIFQDTYTAFIIDNQDMTIYIGLMASTAIDPLTLALLTGGYFDLKPSGVRVKGYITQDPFGTPFFGFGREDSFVSGFSVGAWAHIT